MLPAAPTPSLLYDAYPMSSVTTPSPDAVALKNKSALVDPKTAIVPFKKEKSLEVRKAECSRVRSKYPDMIPVICERHTGAKTLPQSTRRKYLVPPDITMGQFRYVIRKRIQMKPDEALFVFVNDTVMSPTMATLAEVYRQHRDEDGFLYMVYSGESTFG